MRNKATKKNMDLDLRRYGNSLYSKAEQSGGSDDGGGGDSTEIDYEAIYQFYKKEITESAPEPLLLGAIIPEHLSDVQDVSIHNDEYVGKMGIWKINNRLADRLRNINILHAIDVASGSVYYIYFGNYYKDGEID